MRMRMWWLSVVLVCVNCTYGVDDRADFTDLLALSNAQSWTNVAPMQAAQIGVAQGITQVAKSGTAQVLNTLIASPLKKAQTILANTWRVLMRAFHTECGFETRELVWFKWTLERDIMHISKVVAGARVVRAHVLEQQAGQAQQAPATSIPFGVQALKRDLEYIAQQLETRLAYYKKEIQPTNNRYEKILDIAAIASGFGSLWHTMQMTSPEHFDHLAYVETIDLGTLHRTGALEPALEQSKIERIKQYTQAGDHVRAAQAWSWHGNWKNQSIRIAKYAALAALAWRTMHWLKSKNTSLRIDELKGIDRTAVAHLTSTALNYIKRLITLCEQVHEDGDIARLKDDFEFISKSCCETLIHIAQIINQEEAIALQRNKPGQAVSSLAPAPASYPGMLPPL